MGLLDLLLGNTNPIAQGVDKNRGVLQAIGSGLGQGTDLNTGLAAAARNVPQGAQTDLATNQTAQWLHSQGYDDLVPLALGGKGDVAIAQAMARKQPGYGQLVRQPGDYVTDTTTGKTTQVPPNPVAIGPYTTGFHDFATGQNTPVTYGDGSTNGLLPDDTLHMIAQQYLSGDKSVITGYGRSPILRSQIMNAITSEAQSQGMDGKAIAAQLSAYGGNVAAQKAAGTRAAQVGIASSEANQMADIALDASSKVPRGNFVPWNQATQAVQAGTSSPELAQFVAATTSLINAYARAVSPVGAPTDSQRQHAYDMLNTAQSPEAYAAVIAQMKKEMTAALNAPAEVSNRLKGDITGNSPASTPAPAATQTVTPTTQVLGGVTYTKGPDGNWYTQ